MSQVKFLVGLILLTVTTGPVLPQVPEDCVEITKCTEELMSGLINNAPDILCQKMQQFPVCVYGVECSLTMEQKQNIIEEGIAPFRAYTINCESDTSDGSQGGTATGEGYMPPGCVSGFENCTAQFMAVVKDFEGGNFTKLAQGPCKLMNDYVDCISGIDCPSMGKESKQMVIDKALASLKGDGIDCGTGTDPYSAVLGLFNKHKCSTVIRDCGILSQEKPNCGEARKSAQCLFTKCPAIKGTGDDKKAADQLIEFAEKSINCKLTSEELLGSGSIGTLQRPVWGSLTFLLAVVLMTMLLV